MKTNLSYKLHSCNDQSSRSHMCMMHRRIQDITCTWHIFCLKPSNEPHGWPAQNKAPGCKRKVSLRANNMPVVDSISSWERCAKSIHCLRHMLSAQHSSQNIYVGKYDSHWCTNNAKPIVGGLAPSGFAFLGSSSRIQSWFLNLDSSSTLGGIGKLSTKGSCEFAFSGEELECLKILNNV